MSNHTENYLLEKRVDHLEEVNRYTVEMLEQTLTLFDFNLRHQIEHYNYNKAHLLEDAEYRVRQIVPLRDVAFFLVNEENFEFDLAHVSKYTNQDFVNNEVERLIDSWAFSWALRKKRPLFFASDYPDVQVVLHVMTTSTRIRGMFFGTVAKEKVKKIPEVSLLLFSTTLLVCSNFLESIELYEIVNQHNLLLEKKVKERTAQLEYQAYYDNLTNLPNRNMIFERLEQLISEQDNHFAFILVDLNGFKEINDTLGHHTGDNVLREIASKLEVAVRENDLIGRLGGDEFAALLPRIRDEEAAVQVAGRIMQKIDQFFLIGDKQFHIDASIGISLYPQHANEISDLLRKADIAMYKCKREKRGVIVYSHETDNLNSFDLSIKGDFKRALDEEQIFPLFQPRYSFRYNKITGVEALARWIHPQHGYISPAKFIPLAEKSGLIKKLSNHILESSVAHAKTWYDKGLDLKTSINLSALDVQDERLPDKISKLLRSYKLPFDKIELEITESTIMTNPDMAITNIQLLHDLGFSISLDDFGTGYSSLSYLHMFPVDNIKIDLSFVKTMQENSNNRKIVQSIIHLGKSLEKYTVAEGVETRDIAHMLYDMGCDSFQGFYLGKPMTSEEVNSSIGSFVL